MPLKAFDIRLFCSVVLNLKIDFSLTIDHFDRKIKVIFCCRLFSEFWHINL